MQTRPLAVALLLALAGLALAPPPVEAAPTRTLAITGVTAHPTVPFKGFDSNPPKLYDMDGDGDLEIIAQNDNNWVYVFDSRTGAILSQVTTSIPVGWGARSFNGPEASVLQSGGQARLIVLNSAATLTSFVYNPSASTSTHIALVKEWERRLDGCHADPGADSKPVLADLDRDGSLDIFATTEESGVYAVRANGQLLWQKCIGGGNAEGTVGDVNQDGWPDVVFGSDGGIVTAMDGRSGATLWSFNVHSRFQLSSGSMPVGVALGQLDGKLGPDVVVGARDSHDPDDWSQDHALLLALDSRGALLWGKQDPTGNPLTYTHPVIVDADKNGQNEVYWADWNTIGHKPPFDEADAWKVTGPANFYRYDAAGNLIWKQTLGTWWNNKDVPLADVDGDGVQEMVANGPGANGHDGLWMLDSRTGAKESWIDVYPFQVARAPVFGDFYGTGKMQFAVEVGGSGAGGGPGILVYDTGVAYSAAWPHLPDPPAPGSSTPPPPPGSGGTFDATFTIKAPNEWWQELYISPATPRTLAKAEVRINDGVWQAMSKSSWGAWTSSYRAVAGAKVEFLATDTGGAVSQSAPFTWMDGTLTKGSVPPSTPPPPSSFSASFTVPSSVNEWWVEVAVQASDPLAGVDAQVNGGTWTALAKQSWGNWAKSFNVPAGSQVVFRARSAYGDTATSQPFNWMGGSPPPPPGPFTATFAPQAVGNDWWVEVKVTSSSPVSAVDASLNGGPWQALAKQSWGHWAKSIHTPNGTSVTFRATGPDGATATSAPVTWT